MKRFVKSDLLPILAGMACFAVIFAGSGAFTTQKDNGIKHREPPRQRYLCEADQDPLMVNPDVIRHLTDAFNSTVYLRESIFRKQGVARFLVADHGLKFPLHISIETNAEMRSEGGSITRQLKDIYYYNED